MVEENKKAESKNAEVLKSFSIRGREISLDFNLDEIFLSPSDYKELEKNNLIRISNAKRKELEEADKASNELTAKRKAVLDAKKPVKLA